MSRTGRVPDTSSASIGGPCVQTTPLLLSEHPRSSSLSSVVIIRPLSSPFPVSSSSSRPNRLLRGAAGERDTMVDPVGFAEAWRAQFPDSEPPRMELRSARDIEAELASCKRNIRRLEVEVNKERFRMIYLQTLLAKEKKSYDRQRWGFRKSGPEGDRGEARRSPAESHCGAEARADGEQRAVCAAHSPSTLRRCDAEPEFDCDDPTVSRGPPLIPGALASRARRSRGAGPLPGQSCGHGAMNRTKSESSPGLSTAAVGTAGGKPSRVPCLSAGQEPCKLRRHSSQTGEGTQVSSSSGGSSGGGDGGGVGGGAGGGGGMALPTYANVEFHHERGLIRLNERDVSEHITNLGSEAMRFEQQQRRRRLTSATSPGRAEPPASSAAHRAHRQGYGSFETPDRDDAILAEISPRFLKDGLLPLSCVPSALRNIGVEGDLVSALSRQSAPSTTPKEERLSWPKRSNSPSSLEDAGGGYTPDCSSNDNLTSSEEELSSPGCHPGYPGPSASPTSHGASPGSYRLFRDRENRSPSQNSQQSLDSSSPPTPHGAAASGPGGPSVGGASGHGASGAKRATRKTTVVPAKIPGTTASVPDSPQRSPASSGFRRSGQSRPRQGMVDEVFEGCSDMPFNMASPGCVFENERTDERMPTQDGMPYIDDSPSSSPQLSSKGKACRDVALTVPLDAGKSAVRDSDKGLEMRKWVLSGILTSEETYLSHLEALLLPMKPLRAAATTSQPVISVQQVDIIFFRVPELYQVHREFYQALQPRVQQWIHSQCVGDLFQKLASQLGVYRAFVDNYKSAVETAERCCQGNAQFAEISENLKVRSSKEMKEQASKHTLEALLYKPVDRVTRSTLVLHDLLKHTPTNHPDYPLLQDALRISQSFLSSINEEITPRRQSVTVKKGESRQLVKDGFLVELAEGTRKLRHVFLFTDLLLCAKLKKQAPGKPQQYDCKWYIPLADLSFQHPEDMYDTGQPVPVVPDEDIEAMKIKISQIKNDMQREKGGKSNKALERLRKKLSEQESLLLLTSPTMPLRVHNRNGKSFMFITSSDYERAEWREAMREQQKKCFKSFALSSVELQMLTNSCVKLQTVHSIPLTINKEDDESPGLYGFLNIIVHSASGFRQSANLYCTLEVDSYGYFVNKAKTRVYRDTTEPNWNEEFEIELEGSQTLRLLCYDKCYDKAKLGKDEAENVDKIMGKGQIQLDLGVLQEKDWQRAVLPMNGIEVKLSVKFTSREFSLKRMPSRKQTGVYGVKIGVVTKRERSKVPYLVRQCVEEIEKRGLDEVGIYRVSGVATDIQALKAAFDSNDKDASVLMSDMDVNAIAGALKLYFRELPEPLFTDELYPSFVEAIALSEPVAKESCMLNILQTLPEPNLNTFLFLLAHLKRVAEMEPVNKMSLHNLATVFGPTLLRPSEKDTKIVANPAVAITMSDSWSLEVMSQVQVLLYFLQLESIPKPDSKRQSLLFSTEV